MSDKLVLRNNPLVKNLSQSLKAGSLTDLVRAKRQDDIFLLLDCSGSMGGLVRNGNTRINELRKTVAEIQREKEMKMVQFGHGWEPCFVTTIPDDDGGTPLHLAIDFARNNGASRAIVISDGIPDSQDLAMEAAGRFAGRIDVVFVGDPGEYGEIFLRKLAESTGGESFTGDLAEPKQLAGKVIGLLSDGSDDDDED